MAESPQQKKNYDNPFKNETLRIQQPIFLPLKEPPLSGVVCQIFRKPMKLTEILVRSL